VKKNQSSSCEDMLKIKYTTFSRKQCILCETCKYATKFITYYHQLHMYCTHPKKRNVKWYSNLSS